MTATGSSPDGPKRPRGILKNSHSYQAQSSPEPPSPSSAAPAHDADTPPRADRPPMGNREMSEKELVQMNTEINAGGRRNSSNPRASVSRRQSGAEPAAHDQSMSPRLKWDEANLYLNEGQMGGKMKIDEPKTPYVGQYYPDADDMDEDASQINPDDLMVDELDKAKVLGGEGSTHKQKSREGDIPDLDLGEPEQEMLERRPSDGERRVMVDSDKMDVDGARHGEAPEHMNDEEKEKHKKFEEMRKRHYEMHDIKNLLGHGADELDPELDNE